MREKLAWKSLPGGWVLAAAGGGIVIALSVFAVFWSPRMLVSGQSDCVEDLINPSACEGEAKGKVAMTAFRDDLADHLAAVKLRGEVNDAGIYFRDLRFGPTFSVNADGQFLPMSLMKLPVLVAVLKTAERDPAFLDEKLHTPSKFAFNVQLTEPGQTLAPDREYAVRELLEFMVIHSDNKALGMLTDWLELRAGGQAVIDVMVELGLVRRQDSQLATSLTPRMYAAILRILYNASYLSPESSQYALEMLTKTDFAEGITAAVPDDVRVAHKFGVRDDPGVDVQLHDCGIVYHPAGPYVLCIMTRGTSFKAQAAYIQDVSGRVYAEMTRRAELKSEE